MAKSEEPDNPDYYVDSTGHVVYRGSRWHHPKTGDPTKCAVEGCPRVMSAPQKDEDEA